MDEHRRVAPTAVSWQRFSQPFSCFEFVESRFGDNHAIRRIFSLARSFDAQILVIENLPSVGIIEEENSEIKEIVSDYSMSGLLRLSFWGNHLQNISDLDRAISEQLLGYAIVKKDTIPSKSHDRWHVFEAVMRKYGHEHNCVPNQRHYRLGVCGREYAIPGVLYCQQNAINKACAHVALRSLISRHIDYADISYARINALAGVQTIKNRFSEGLTVPQIRSVLDGCGIAYTDVDYSLFRSDPDSIPYQKLLYGGIESGAGSLIGFKLSGRNLETESRHIIPLFGHTFNKDTWAPNADVAYFHIDEQVGYIPSESWTSSFIGHDDNFGPNFCIPRLYITQDQAEYVIELHRSGISYSSAQAETIALFMLYSIVPFVFNETNPWIQRLAQWTRQQQIIFRAIPVSKSEYAEHIRCLRDWEGNQEGVAISSLVEKIFPSHVYMVEISTPHLFPANERKLGEIILDATMVGAEPGQKEFDRLFVMARFPGMYLVAGDADDTGRLGFDKFVNPISSHTPLFRYPE